VRFVAVEESAHTPVFPGSWATFGGPLQAEYSLFQPIEPGRGGIGTFGVNVVVDRFEVETGAVGQFNV
jgi:hypothetical protein